ncbi:MAG: [LysW]-aminoadipate/[LysW]-glutamate kinase [Desulfurococcales archaeon]|nr:[LysW]-aminoadipate/[LysW]-glutamate kinase [Desulfurococcales archaeon]
MLVVKVGGRALMANMDGILEDLARASGEGVVLVHGGGDLVTEYSRRLGVEPRIVTHPSGIRSRYTSLEELEVYTMVMAGLLNKRIVSKLQHMGVRSLGVTGADLGLVRGVRKKRIVVLNERGRPQAIPGGYTGKITSVDVEAFRSLLGLAQVLVVTPLILGGEGELLNVDGDQAAMALARALKPRALLMLSDVDGVILDGRLVRRLSPGEARELASRVGKGMNRKLLMAAEAVESGVGSVAICNGLAEAPVSGCLDRGTVIG